MNVSGPTSPESRVRRHDRAHYDPVVIREILDEATVAHVGFVDERPIVIPMLHAVVDDHVVLHGSRTSRFIKVLSRGIDVAVTVTIVDGLVLARSAFHSSANYRSVVVLGRSEAITDPADVRRALDAMTDRLLPGRRSALRPMTDREVAATGVVRVSLETASAKIRSGGPIDDEDDLDDPVWAGVVPLSQTAGAPVPADDLAPGHQIPDHVRRLV